MTLEALASVMRGHRYLARGGELAAAALAAVPGLADGLPLNGSRPLAAHALDALAPAAERLITTVFAEVDSGAPSDGGEEDAFVPTLRDLIGFGAQTSPAAGALAVLQAARAVSDVLNHPSARMAPIVNRLREGTPEARGIYARGVGHALSSRAAAAVSAAAAAGWEMPDFAGALVANPLAWIYGRGTLDVDPQLPMVAAYLGSSLPAGILTAAEASMRSVLGEVVARWTARKSRPEDQLLLLRGLSPALMDAGADAVLRNAMVDPDLLAGVLPLLARFTDARALAKAGVEKGAAEALLRPETGVAVASVLIDVALELRRWDVLSLLIAAQVRADSRATMPVAAFGPRRRVLQGAVVAVVGRAGAGSERPFGAVHPPADALVADHGAVAFVVFASPADACRWALDVVDGLGDKVSVGVGFGRILGGTDGERTRIDGPAAQGSLAALRLGRVGLSAGAADELVQTRPAPAGSLPEGRLGCLLDDKIGTLDLVAGMTGVFELGLLEGTRPAPSSARPAPVPAPLRLAPVVEAPAVVAGAPAPEVPRPEIKAPPVPPPPVATAPADRSFRPAAAPPQARPVALAGFGEGVDPFRLAASGAMAAGDNPWDESPTSVQAPPAPRVEAPPRPEPSFDADAHPTMYPLPGGFDGPASDGLDEVTLPGLSSERPPVAGDPFNDATDFGASDDTQTGEVREATASSPVGASEAPPARSTPASLDPVFEESFPFTLDGEGDPFQVPEELLDAGEVAAPVIPAPPPPVVSAPPAPVVPAPHPPVVSAPPARTETPVAPEAAGAFAFGFDPVEEPPSSLGADDLVAAAFGFTDVPAAASVAPASTPPINVIREASPAPDPVAPAARAPVAASIDLGMDDFSFDLGGDHDLTDPEALGRKVAPNTKMLANFGFERTDDDETHLERISDETSALQGPWNANVDPGHAFDLEVEEEETNVVTGHSLAPVADPGGFAFVESIAPDPVPEVASPSPPRRADAPAEPVARRGKPVAMNFEHLFRGYCFYLEQDNAVFGRPYGSRMVDRHAYPFGGDVEDAYRAFLQDKIREGFVPQTDMAADVPPATTLLPLNLERLGRAWGRLT